VPSGFAVRPAARPRRPCCLLRPPTRAADTPPRRGAWSPPPAGQGWGGSGGLAGRPSAGWSRSPHKQSPITLCNSFRSRIPLMRKSFRPLSRFFFRPTPPTASRSDVSSCSHCTNSARPVRAVTDWPDSGQRAFSINPEGYARRRAYLYHFHIEWHTSRMIYSIRHRSPPKRKGFWLP
jgi:hypothetical protein